MSSKPVSGEIERLLSAVRQAAGEPENQEPDPAQPAALPAQLTQEPSLRSVLARIRSSSGYRHALKVALRRWVVAALAVARGYLDQERALTTSLMQENAILARRIADLEEELALMRQVNQELLQLAKETASTLQKLKETNS